MQLLNAFGPARLWTQFLPADHADATKKKTNPKAANCFDFRRQANAPMVWPRQWNR